ncbi:CPBP family glutamic-type intramembrane protease [Shouchella miscanthi]|uniref:CPBP family glutamic-type intramembrane protease n=1 Tax=Shouchella miscanthi TaxID=2598861 RepID=UPI001FE69EB0|nr:CPBP family glutamic-type intramembrane protease [Shouchella miscanthi]
MVKEYIMSTYMMFYVLLLFIGFLMFLLESHFLIDLFIVLSSWTSTFVFVLMFRRIYPEENLWLFVKRQFNKRIKWSTMFSISMMSLIVLLCSIFTTYFIWDIPVYDQLLASWTSLLIIFGYNLLLGPLGEELGWRGFVLKELQEVYNPLISSIIVGFFWGFWHTPLWFLSGYTGIHLLQYIFSFLIGIMAISIIITAFFTIHKNLLIPISIHQFFNFTIAIQVGELLTILTVTSLFYLLIALIIIIVNYKECLYTRNQST